MNSAAGRTRDVAETYGQGMFHTVQFGSLDMEVFGLFGRSKRGVRMIRVYNNETNRYLGEITEAQLQFLIDMLEEESLEDRDYYLNRATIEMLEREQGDPGLIKILRGALGDGDGVEIRWERE